MNNITLRAEKNDFRASMIFNDVQDLLIGNLIHILILFHSCYYANVPKPG
jgi:hypothetical protein